MEWNGPSDLAGLLGCTKDSTRFTERRGSVHHFGRYFYRTGLTLLEVFRRAGIEDVHDRQDESVRHRLGTLDVVTQDAFTDPQLFGELRCAADLRRTLSQD